MKNFKKPAIDTFNEDLDQLLSKLPAPLGRLAVDVSVTMTMTESASGVLERTFAANINPRKL